MSALENIAVLMDTLEIFRGYEESDGVEPLEDYISKHEEIHVFLPDDVEKIRKEKPKRQVQVTGQCKITCEDADSFTLACKIQKELMSSSVISKTDPECLVMNFANPYYPGGGVRRGAVAQEEDLCRRSSLLLSLETEEAQRYYRYNKDFSKRDFYGNDYGTNSMMISPIVKVVKNKRYERESKYTQIAVLTVAAPIIRNKLHLADSYFELMYKRIQSVLYCAAYYGYTHLVFGAWGCGAFNNDPETVSEIFKDVIENFSYDGKSVHELFELISFAVPYSKRRPANYLAFQKQFGGM